MQRRWLASLLHDHLFVVPHAARSADGERPGPARAAGMCGATTAGPASRTGLCVHCELCRRRAVVQAPASGCTAAAAPDARQRPLPSCRRRRPLAPGPLPSAPIINAPGPLQGRTQAATCTAKCQPRVGCPILVVRCALMSGKPRRATELDSAEKQPSRGRRGCDDQQPLYSGCTYVCTQLSCPASRPSGALSSAPHSLSVYLPAMFCSCIISPLPQQLARRWTRPTGGLSRPQRYSDFPAS